MAGFTEDILLAPEDELVCYCGSVTKGAVLSLIRSGERDLPNLKTRSGACGDQCSQHNPRGRCCTPEIVRLLRHECGSLSPVS